MIIVSSRMTDWATHMSSLTRYRKKKDEDHLFLLSVYCVSLHRA